MPAVPAPAAVAALGRLEPRDGVLRVAGPSLVTVVVARLLVEEGDRVELNVMELGEEEALGAFTFRFGELVEAERASLFLVDGDELWLRVARREQGQPLDVRFPIDRGIAGEVVRTGRPRRVDDAYAEPLFNPDVDRATGYRTRSILCVPIVDRAGRVFAVAQLLNKRGGEPFDATDEQRFTTFATSIGRLLESWTRMRHARRA